MQQSELLPTHHPACFSICQLMTGKHRAVQRELSCRLGSCTSKWNQIQENIFTWQNGGGCPTCLPIFPKRKCRRSLQASDTPRSVINSDKVWLCGFVSYRAEFTDKKVLLHTRMEMMPLCFSSIRSQMILLSKYFTVSHWEGNNKYSWV